MSEEKKTRVDGAAVREGAVARGDALREAAVSDGERLRERAVAHAAEVMQGMTGAARVAPAQVAATVSDTQVAQSVPVTLATASDETDASTQAPASKTETAGV